LYAIAGLLPLGTLADLQLPIVLVNNVEPLLLHLQVLHVHVGVVGTSVNLSVSISMRWAGCRNSVRMGREARVVERARERREIHVHMCTIGTMWMRGRRRRRDREVNLQIIFVCIWVVCLVIFLRLLGGGGDLLLMSAMRRAAPRKMKITRTSSMWRASP
jgi:hypothetical protein